MELILNILRSISYVLVEPTYLFMFVIIGIMFYIRNQKVSIIQRMTIGESINSPLELTLSQLVIGILAGVAGSILLGLLGVVFTEKSGVEWIFLVSIILIFMKPRFVCFSYSAAIVSAISLLANYIATYTNQETYLDINILQIMTLVAVIHIVEGFLILIDGKRGAIPVFSQKENKIVGGFAFDRIWAIPVAILTALSISYGDIQSTPDWWPIINKAETFKILATTFLTALPFYGMVGYKAITFTKTKSQKVAISALSVCTYGVSLLLISQLARFGLWGQIIVIIYAPLAHEAMLKIQRVIEEKSKYLYYSDDDGVAILEVSPNSDAYNAGIRRGFKIVEINNQKVTSEVDALVAIKSSTNLLHFKMRDLSGKINEYSIKKGNKRIGILLVPRLVNKKDIERIDKDSAFKKVLDELKNRK